MHVARCCTMRTVRVYSEEPLAAESTVCLRGDAALHVATVLRMREEDALVLFDGNGKDYAGIIRSVDKKAVTVELAHSNETQTESALKITLWHGICRGGRMDYVVQKATELGVYAVQPLFTARGMVRLDQERAAAIDAGFKLVSLAHRVLRSETAPVVALGIAHHMAGDLDRSSSH